MIGCGNPMREPLPLVLGRVRNELADGAGLLCVCMERRGRVVLTSTANAIPSEVLVTVKRGCPEALNLAAEAVAHELVSRAMKAARPN